MRSPCKGSSTTQRTYTWERNCAEILSAPRRGVPVLNGILYRCFAADGSLLYIGQTIRGGARFSEHYAGKTWWSDVARIEVEHAPRAELNRLERAAIVGERPLFNVALIDQSVSDVWYECSDADPVTGCSEMLGDELEQRCNRSIAFKTSLGNYVCQRCARFYGFVVRVDDDGIPF